MPHWLTRCILGAAMLALLALAPFNSDARVETAGASTGISMTCLSGCRFDPQTVTIFAGATVVWTGADGIHTSTSDSAIWGSGDLLVGQSFSRTFDAPGVFPYHCNFHSLFGMIGTITVIAASNHVFTPVLDKESDGL
ncbi:MAG: plastocyanin/azurin family copper-binding protein [Dehalococcoidia bacterium]|nr:plastocyanin/azurin family copper-binding protein [Dehalococcoidia bacterium]